QLGIHNVKGACGPLMGRRAIAGPIAPRLYGPERLLRPLRGRTRHGEVVLLRQVSADLIEGPHAIRQQLLFGGV
ncbi:Os11g0648700, partial [Oryza sativa Japonica Group]